jgi:DNA-binding IclR family transcriptional regulator
VTRDEGGPDEPKTGPAGAALRRGQKSAHGDPVVDRALALLTAFSAERRALTLSELSRNAGLPLSTTSRLAGRLVVWKALERRADGRYVIGLRLLEVASLAPRGHGLRELAMPAMSDLAEATHQHVLLAVLEESEAMLVERLSHRSAMPVHYRVGGRMPLHSTAVGLVLLAHAEQDLQELVLSQPLVHQPEGTVVDRVALRATLAEIRRNGVAEFRRQSPSPLLAVATPIWDSDDTCCAAMSVLVPNGAVPAATLSPAVRAAGRAISRALGAPRAMGRPATVTAQSQLRNRQ